MKKQIVSLLLAAAMVSALAACSSKPTVSPSTAAEVKNTASGEVIVFAAASMTETLDGAIALYKTIAPDVTVIPNYDSSGTLKTQIEEGAICDLFISAAQKQMDQLDTAAASNEGLDFILSDSRINFLENKVVLVVPKDNKADIKTFSDLGTDKLSLLCIGNEDVPVGAYSEEILSGLGILETLETSKKLTYGSNVKEVTTQVSEGAVDAGIIYATDAFSAGLTVVEQAAPDMCKQVIYPAAVLKSAQNEAAAKDFLSFLQTPEAMDIFKNVGFTTPK